MALPFILGIRLVILQSKVKGVSARALGQFAARTRRAAGVRGEVDVLVTSSAVLRRLNRRFRGKNAATDVLSFPSHDKIHHGGTETRRKGAGSRTQDAGTRRPVLHVACLLPPASCNSSVAPCLSGGCFAGDLAISAEIAASNARRLGHSAGDELKILILHGLLHLAGYDHETDSGEMARKETRLRRLLGLPAALIERTTPADGKIHHGGTETRRSSFSKSYVPSCLRGGRSARRS